MAHDEDGMIARQHCLTMMRPALRAAALLAVSAVTPFARSGAQMATSCASPSGVAPSGILVTTTPPNVTVQWQAVSGARRYAVARRNPDGSCWNLTGKGTTATSLVESSPVAPGLYAYQVAVQTLTGSGVSQWVPFTVAAPSIASRGFTLAGFTAAGTAAAVASRTIAVAGFTAAGATAAVASRTFSLAGISAAGAAAAVASRSFSLAGFSAAGVSVTVASRSFPLAGFTATGTVATVASRTLTLAGFNALGASVAVGARTFTLAGWTAAGSNEEP